MSYWVDGYFARFWNQPNVWFCPQRGVFIPKFATIKNDQDNERIYITKQFAEAILLPGRVFDTTDKYDLLAMGLKNKINVPWVREVSLLPPTALPEF